MAKWVFEPGHSAAEFSARHMMVTWVRGHFINVQGTLEYDSSDPARSSAHAIINAAEICTGDPERDAHLRSADFLDVENHPHITFTSTGVELIGENDYAVSGNLTLRGVTCPVVLDVQYLGQWQTPWWEGEVNKGPKARAGFVASTKINRHNFGVSWNATLEKGGVVVGHEVFITIDIEAILETN